MEFQTTDICPDFCCIRALCKAIILSTMGKEEKVHRIKNKLKLDK
jgi:hypothetical protein